MRDLALLPKAHLHVHREGAMRPSTLSTLAAQYSIDVPPIRGFGSFAAFAGMYVAACEVLQAEDVIRRLFDEGGAGEGNGARARGGGGGGGRRARRRGGGRARFLPPSLRGATRVDGFRAR